MMIGWMEQTDGPQIADKDKIYADTYSVTVSDGAWSCWYSIPMYDNPTYHTAPSWYVASVQCYKLQESHPDWTE